MPVVPVPIAPEVITSHASLDVAVHVQVVPFVANVKEFVPPTAVKLAALEEKPVTEQPAPSCETVWTCPPAVMVALRLAAPLFVDTE